jgi:CO/xanthine dehydrogenase Mo-binding subunit
MKLSGMLHGKVLRSPFPHARIVHIDTSRARALPGVKVVVTGADTPDRLWGPIYKEHRILACGKVRFAGEEVAAVAAIDEATALDAIERIRVEYEELPPVLDPEAALQPEAPQVHEDRSNLALELRVDRGDIDEGFRKAAAIYEATYDMAYQYPGYMEPMGTIATVEPNGRLTLWAPAQAVFRTRQYVAEALDIPVSRIRVIQTVTGGGFGGKNSEDANSPIAAFLALKARRAVRLVNNRLEDFVGARASPAARIWLRMGVARDGEILAKESSILLDNGAYSCLASRTLHNAMLRSDSMHRLRNVRSHARLVFTNKVPSGAFRGMGNAHMSFALNSHLAALADMIDMDPVDLHLRNAIRTGDTSVHGWHIGSCGLAECLQRARDAIGWKEKHRHVLGESTRRRGVGIGAAVFFSGNRSSHGNWDGSTAILKMNEDGRVTLVTGESDIGQGSNTVLSQICANEIGIPLDHITVSAPDTDVAAFGHGSIASRVTLVAGNAVIKAAREVREKLLAIAADKMEVAPSDLAIEDGVIHVVGVPEKCITVAEASRLHIYRPGGEAIYTRATFDPPTVPGDEKHYGNVSAGYTFAAQTVEVEVDTETGQVRVVDGFCADDCGKALNPLLVEGQTYGAMTQGIGWTLYEAMRFEDGRLINPDFADYTMPTAESVPHLRSALVESNEPNGPYGAKGASETAIMPTAGAIANAIFDAVGVRITSLPITPEKILDALREKQRRA